MNWGTRNLELERLRAYASVAVVFSHLSFVFPKLSSHLWGSTYGVDLFFVISGFIVTTTFLKSKQGTTAFYLRRFCRIFPLAFLCALYFGVRYFFPPQAPFQDFFNSVPEALVSLATLQFNYALANRVDFGNMALFWTLMVEEHFYLLLPLFLLKFTDNRKRLAICVGGILLTRWVLMPLTAQLWDPQYMHRAVSYCTHCRSDQLFIGVAIALIHQTSFKNKIETSLRETSRGLLIVTCWLAVVAIHFYRLFAETAFGTKTPLPLILMCCTTLVLLSSFQSNLVLALPKHLSRIVEYLGSRSYGIYIWHLPVIHEIAFAQPKWPLLVQTGYHLVFFTFFFTTLIAELSYRWIEIPIISWGRRWSVKL